MGESEKKPELEPPTRLAQTRQDVTANWAASSDTAEIPPDQVNVPGYDILDVLGRGGMGVVYRARDQRLKRLVALKMILAGEYADKKLLARFRGEAETVARLAHPNIVQIYDVGEHEGRPYLTLELVEGGSLADHAQAHGLTPREAAAIVETLARAIQYAHQQGVVHRDLKPGNILLVDKSADHDTLDTSGTAVAKSDSSQLTSATLSSSSPGLTTSGPVAKIADFGLAKQLDTQSELTQSGTILGTPGYMPPEQAGGNHDVGPAADIYSLGAILYWAITQRPPFVGENLLQTITMVERDDPVPPTRLQPRLSRDLETICLKCLEKQPSRRYATAGDLAADLRRFLNSEPIEARPVGPVERAWKWTRRYPAVATVILVLIIATPLLAWKWREAALAGSALSRSNVELGETLKRAVRAEKDALHQRDVSVRREAELRFDRGVELCNAGRVDEGLHWLLQSLRADPKATPEFRRLVRTNLATWIQQADKTVGMLPHPNHVIAAAFSPDGRLLVTGCEDGTICGWELPSAKPLGAIIEQRDGGIRVLEFSPDGSRLLVGWGHQSQEKTPGGCRQWDTTSFQEIGPLLTGETGVYFAKYSHDGRRVATGNWRGRVHILDADSGMQVCPEMTTYRDDVAKLAFSPDDGTLYTVSQRYEAGAVERWDVATGERIGEPWLHDEGRSSVNFVVFSPDGRLTVTGGGDAALRFRTPGADAEAFPPWYHRVPAMMAEFAPDGRRLIVGLTDGTIPFWDLGTGELTHQLAHTSSVGMISTSRDGHWLVSGSDSGYARLWRLGRSLSRIRRRSETNQAIRYVPTHSLFSPRASWSPDGGRVITAAINRDGVARMMDAESGQFRGPPLRHSWDSIRAAQFSPDGRIAAIGGFQSAAGVNGYIALWDITTSSPQRRVIEHANYVAALSFNPRGDLIAAGDYDKLVRFWDPHTGEEVGPAITENDIVLSLDFSPDGETLAVGTAHDWSGDPHVQLWDVTTREPIGPPMPHTNSVWSVEFSPDGQGLLITSGGDPCLLRETKSGRVIGRPIDVPQGFAASGFAPDGRSVFIGSGDGIVKQYSTDDGDQLGQALQHPYPVRAVAVHPSGRMILVGCSDGSAWLWDVATSRQLGAPMVQSRGLIAVSFSTDGRRCVSVATDERVRSWPLPEPLREEPERIEEAVEVLTALKRDAVTPYSPADWRAQAARVDLTLGVEIGARDWHLAQASDAEQDHDWFAARWHLDRLIALDNSDWWLHARRARTWSAEQDFESAERDYQAAGSGRDSDGSELSNWYRHRAYESRRNGQKQVAVWYLERLLALDPDDAQARSDLAKLE